MPITYENNEQIVIEIKKLMLENKISQREIADKMNIKPQGLTKILSKKNFGFEDAEKILSAMGYNLVVDFMERDGSGLLPQPNPKQIPTESQAVPKPEPARDKAHPQNVPHNVPQSVPQTVPQGRQLSANIAEHIDLKRLISDIQYQAEIGKAIGFDELNRLYQQAKDLGDE